MPPNPEDFLPLRPVELQALVALRASELHGYGILREIERKGGTVPGMVTLYRALRRMEQQGLVEQADDGEAPRDPEHDRRRTYRITPLGVRVVRAEALRLSPLVRAALEGGAPRGEGDPT